MCWPSITLKLFLVVNLCVGITYSIKCWQCATVDNRKCPENANLVDSLSHDSCITWRLGNGSIILQNVVNYKDECTQDKINFWTRFVDLYYQRSGGEVRCCNVDGCNTGAGFAADDSHSTPTLTHTSLDLTPMPSQNSMNFPQGFPSIGMCSYLLRGISKLFSPFPTANPFYEGQFEMFVT